LSTWYTGTDRHERIANALAVNGFGCLLALTPENAAYLSGQSNYIATNWRVPGLFSVAIGTRGARAVVAPDFGGDPAVSTSDERFAFRIWTESIDVRGVAGDSIAERVRAARSGTVARPAQFDLEEVLDRVAEAVRAVAPEVNRVGADLESVSAMSRDGLQRRLPVVDWVEATSVFDDLRALKDADEIALLRLAGELTEVGIAGAVARLEPGMSEAAVNAAYQVAVHERVITDSRFAAFRQAEGLASIGFGADVPHVVGPGRTIKFDMQVDVGGYHSDIGRTYAMAPTREQRDVFAALHGALTAAQERVKPGVTFAEVFRVGTAAMHDAGYANYGRGHLGHSVGLTQHFEEPPFIAPDESRPLVPGMVVSLELPYYVYGVGAFQLERMLLITADGHEAIDRLPFDFELPF
jgi:Xaa-Pro aminopeptidase